MHSLALDDQWHIPPLCTTHAHLGHLRLQPPHLWTRWFFNSCFLPQSPCPKLCHSIFRQMPGRGSAVNRSFRNPAGFLSYFSLQLSPQYFSPAATNCTYFEVIATQNFHFPQYLCIYWNAPLYLDHC